MANTKVIDLKGAGAAFRADHKRAVASVRLGLIEAALEAEVIISQATPVDTGNTRLRWQTVITTDGAEVVNDSPVALYLEEGTKPHRPPLWPLILWLARKNGRSLAGATTLKDVPGELVGAARKIQARIEVQGTKGKKMIASNLPKLEAIAKKRVEQRLKAASDARSGEDKS